MPLTPAGPINVVDDLPVERSAFVELLRTLEPDEWLRPTECPAYDVKGIAAHILGDDLSLLSRQRDAAPPGLLELMATGTDFRTALDAFNDRWVEAARFFSPTLLIEMLELAGEWTADWYRFEDVESLGEPVGFFGATGPSPYWQIAAREYVERWVHHHQIRRAVGRPNLDEAAILLPAVGTVVRGLAANLRDLDAQPDDSIALSVEGLDPWTFVRGSESWQLFGGQPEQPNSQLGMDRANATTALSRGLTAAEVEAAFTVEGDQDLGRRVARGIAVFAGRPELSAEQILRHRDADRR